VEIAAELWLPEPPEPLFDFLVEPEAMTLFEGWGLVPGIARVERGPGEGVGREDRVVNTDGSAHRERVIDYDRPRAYGLDIHAFEPPVGRLVARIEEQWRLRPERDGTRVERRFVFTPRNALGRAFVRTVLAPMFRRAVARHHGRLRERFVAA